MWWELALVVVAAVAPYLNSVTGEYVLDDDRAVRDNKDVLWGRDVGKIFENDFWGTPLASNASHKSYRPLTVLTFKATHGVAGHNPTAFHVGNIALYAVSCGLWLWFLGGIERLSRKGRLVAALFFTLHPMHVENVASIVGRADVLCFIFMLLSITTYRKSYPLSIAFYVLSTFSKELGIVTLALAAVHDIAASKALHSVKNITRRLVLRTVLSGVISISLLVFSSYLRGARMTPKMSYVDNPIAFYTSTAEKVSHYTYVHAWYFLLSVFPSWSCSDWGVNVLPNDYGALPAVAAYSCVAGIPLWGFFHTAHRNLFAISTSLIVIPFLPASGLVPVGTVLAERLLFIPTAGFSIWAGLLFDSLLTRTGRRRSSYLYMATAAVFVFFTYKTITRSDDWNTPEKLFKGTIKDCPRSAKAQYSLGVVYMQKNNVSLAVPCFKAALAAYPEYAEALVGVGRIYKDNGKLEESSKYFVKALQSEPKHVDANHHLGVILSQTGDTEKGIKLIEKALRLHKSLLLPSTPSDLHGNYAAALGMAGRTDDSIAAFCEALSHPGTPPSTRCLWYRNLAVLCFRSKRFGEAKTYLTEILQPPCAAGLSKEERATYQRHLDQIEAAGSD